MSGAAARTGKKKVEKILKIIKKNRGGVYNEITQKKTKWGEYLN